MKFIYAVFALSAVVSSVFATPALSNTYMRRIVLDNLIPEFGVTAGVNPTGTGDCDGTKGIKIPCRCPPPRDIFIADLKANVAAGHCIKNLGVAVPPFPTDNSIQSQLTILEICTVTLQNALGPGEGCPQAATTWGAQRDALQAHNP